MGNIHADWAELRAQLRETDIDTYFAVHSNGHSDGWKGLTQLLTDKINDRMDEIRERIENCSDDYELAKLRGHINGLRDTLQLITESNQ